MKDKILTANKTHNESAANFPNKGVDGTIFISKAFGFRVNLKINQKQKQLTESPNRKNVSHVLQCIMCTNKLVV